MTGGTSAIYLKSRKEVEVPIEAQPFAERDLAPYPRLGKLLHWLHHRHFLEA